MRFATTVYPIFASRYYTIPLMDPYVIGLRAFGGRHTLRERIMSVYMFLPGVYDFEQVR